MIHETLAQICRNQVKDMIKALKELTMADLARVWAYTHNTGARSLLTRQAVKNVEETHPHILFLKASWMNLPVCFRKAGYPNSPYGPHIHKTHYHPTRRMAQIKHSSLGELPLGSWILIEGSERKILWPSRLHSRVIETQ